MMSPNLKVKFERIVHKREIWRPMVQEAEAFIVDFSATYKNTFYNPTRCPV